MQAGGKSLAEQAYDELERRLVTLELSPGMFLQEKELAADLGLGRTPVREAIQRLAGQGLLKIYPRKGILVEPLRAESLARVLEARRVMERLLVVKAAARADAAQRRDLQNLAAGFTDAGHQPAAFFELDRALDDLLSEACQNPFLVQALAPLHAHCRRLWYLFRADLDTAEAATLHAHLANAVAVDDSAGAIRSLNGIISILEGLQARLEARS